MKEKIRKLFSDVWTIPNVLTMIRLILVPVFVIVFQAGHTKWALAIFCAASLTDLLDGYLARKLNQVTDFGKLFDPLADKLMVLTALFCQGAAGVFPWTAIWIVLGKEILMMLGGTFMLNRGIVVSANYYGKTATVFFMASLICSFFHRELAYVEGEFFEDYIHDMKLTQRYAMLNRQAMTEVILRGMGLTETERFTTIHNYIDTDSMILRKGAVSSKAGEKLLIPINMRDGSLICIGKGNADWNCSAPHGAGRLMSRRQAARELSMEEFKASMEGIFTTCVERKTLDESPMAYKSMEDIVENIGPTAEIVKVIRPVYNFKAAE